MLQQGQSVGVREVQRAIGMSSPSVSSHHLNKLVDMDLIKKLPDNSYELKRVVKVGILRNFVAYRGVLAPIGLFDRYIAIAVGIVGALFAWFETYRLWKIKLT
jgi:DNA-binding transcriptional ArsR family regulator